MVPITPDDAIRMVLVVRDLHEETARLLNRYGYQPLANSQAEQELQSFPRQESVKTAYSQGALLIEVVADQTIAFTKTVTEPVQTVAPWTCVRALLEASALSCWLLDPKIDVRTRIQRSFAFRYEGLSQQVKFGRARRANADIAKVLARIDNVERVALGLGFSKVENPKGERIGIGQQMPSTTEIIRDMLGEEANYRLLSAAAHAHHWALQQLSFRSVDEQGANSESVGDNVAGRFFEKNIEPLAVTFLCALAGKYFAKPIKHKSGLFGWDTRPLEDILDIAFGQMGIPKESKLWHSQ